jgi:hypothetical protein
LALLLVPADAQLEEAEPGCSPVGDCAPCTAAQKQEWYCEPTGFARELTCVASNGLRANTTKTVSCSSGTSGVGGFLKFELAMVVVVAVSLIFTNRRKARLMNLQHNRIAQYLHT